MERRTKKPIQEKAVDQKPQWKKITSGTLYPFPHKRNRRVKPSEVISATKEELGGFVNQFKLVREGTGIYAPKKAITKPISKPKAEKEDTTVDSAAAVKAQPTRRTKKTDSKDKGFSIQKNEATGGFNVVSAAGKVINDEELIEESAKALLENLEKGSSQ